MTSHAESVPRAQRVGRRSPRPVTLAVAGNVRAEMARQRVPQQVVAEKLGLTQQAVSNRLHGRVPFDVDELVDVAELLDVAAASLLERSAP